jgi:four helix bundle protein
MERIEDRTYKFALRVIKLVQVLPKDVAGQIMGRQVLRAATSVGANVEEAIGHTTRREFGHKMSIALREAREAHYWLRLICDAGLVSRNRITSLIQEALEIKKILSKTVATAKKRITPRRTP